MNLHFRPRLLCLAVSMLLVVLSAYSASAKPGQQSSQKVRPTSVPGSETILNLSDFNAVGDGTTDDGPALQAALDALANAGGGTLFIPAGRYLIATPVTKNFSNVANATVNIVGVPSLTMPAPPHASGNELAASLDLVSELIPATGAQNSAITLSNISDLKFEHLAFTGRESQITDAFITLFVNDIDKAIIRHCEFYGLSSFGLIPNLGGGNIVRAVRSDLSIELSVFLGCTANSGGYAPVVENIEWRGISISNAIFIDYGIRSFYSKTGLGAPLSWINIANAAAITPESHWREVVVRDVFLDEGGWVGISSLPHLWDPPSAPIDLLYISGLKMNVSNFSMSGHLLYDLKNVLIENSHYGWSHNALAAIDLRRTGNVILDRLTCVLDADRIRTDDRTDRLTVINSVYGGLDSEAQTTTVMQTAPEDDPVQYVRQQFVSTLGRQPDPAAHFYWSDWLIRCGADSACVNQRRSQLNEYLADNPNPDFSIVGTVTDENGVALTGATVRLTGSQSAVALTDSSGGFRFSRLPTSGNYTIEINKRHYNFITSTQTFVHPNDDVTVVFNARLNRHSIGGRITRMDGTGISGIAVQVAPTVIATTDEQGFYSFGDLPAGQNYTISIPSPGDFAFVPASAESNDLSENRVVNFVGKLQYFSIVGTVSDENGAPLSAATISLTGPQSALASTDSTGRFQFSRLPTNGTYTVEISKRHYTFITTGQTFVNPDYDVTVAFNARLNRHSIGGQITRADGTGIPGIAVQLAQTPTVIATTNEQGFYTFGNQPAGQNYTISVPPSGDFVFAPASTTTHDLSENRVVNFLGQIRQVSIGGTVSDENGSPLSGATISLTGSQSATALTDSTGGFRFSSLPVNGNYTIEISKRHYSFITTSHTFVHPNDDLTVVFNARLNRHSIGGRITRTDGTGIPAIAVKLAPTVVATTNAEGFYSFSNLPAGQNYTISVDPAGDLIFLPASTTTHDLSEDRVVNFRGKVHPKLLTLENSDIAIALDAVTFTAAPFSNFNIEFSPDDFMRVVVLAKDVEPTANRSQASMVAEDEAGHLYPLEIEYMGQVPGQSWLTQLNLKVPPTLLDGGCVQIRFSVDAINSNTARICFAERVPN